MTNLDFVIELIPAAVQTLASAFQTDPIVAYMLNGLTPTKKRLAYIPELFKGFLTSSCLNGGWIIQTPKSEDGLPGACALVLPPGGDPANPWTMIQSGVLGVVWNLGLSGVRRIMSDYAGSADAAKTRAMGINADGTAKTAEEKERYVSPCLASDWPCARSFVVVGEGGGFGAN